MWGKPTNASIQKLKIKNEMISALEIRLPVRTLSLGVLKRIHLQRGHCSENALMPALRSAQMPGGVELMQKLPNDFKRHVAVRRIDPPAVSRRLAK